MVEGGLYDVLVRVQMDVGGARFVVRAEVSMTGVL